MNRTKLERVKSFGRRAIAAAGVGMVGVSSAAITVTDVTDALGDAATAAATIGVAYLTMVVGMRVYKWVKAAF